MTAAVPTREPDRLAVGATWAWRREDLGDYSAADGWTLTYVFRSSSAGFTFDASADGAAFAVSVAKTTTAAYTAGSYTWAATVNKAGESFEVGRGTLVVLPSLASGDPRTHARKVLDAIEAVIEGRAARSDLAYEIAVNGSMRRLQSIPHADLVKLRVQYRAEVKAEENAAAIAQGRGSRRRILTRFTRPS